MHRESSRRIRLQGAREGRLREEEEDNKGHHGGGGLGSGLSAG